MAPFQAAKIPLVKTELLCGLDLRQAQGLTSALEAHGIGRREFKLKLTFLDAHR